MLEKASFFRIAAVGAVALLAVGCSSAQESRESRFLSPATSNRSLAASDGLGLMVFGDSATAAKPKLPKNWKLAAAE